MGSDIGMITNMDELMESDIDITITIPPGGNAEVDQNRPGIQNPEIGWLQIPVHHTDLMKLVDCLDEHTDEFQVFFSGEVLGRTLGNVLHDKSQMVE